MGFIEKMIEKIVKKYSTSDPKKICACLDIEILFLDLGNMWGFKTKSNRINIVYININLTEDTQNFVIAHELGHILLHNGINTPFFKNVCANSFIPKIEHEANLFAIQLLSYNYEHFEGCTIEQKIKTLGIPEELNYLFYSQSKCNL